MATRVSPSKRLYMVRQIESQMAPMRKERERLTVRLNALRIKRASLLRALLPVVQVGQPGKDTLCGRALRICADGWVRYSDIADRLGVTAKDAGPAIRRLRLGGWLESERPIEPSPKPQRYRATKKALRLLRAKP